MSAPLHIVDATMFWSPTGGGVRRYLTSKQAWLARQPGWRHTLAVPRVGAAASEPATLPSWPLPASGGYRLPLGRTAMRDVLMRLQPDIIEAGDPYRVAWAVRDAAQQLGVPALAFCHSNLEAMAGIVGGRWLGRGLARWARRYLRHVYAGFDLVLAPSRSMTAHLAEAGVGRVACQPLGVDCATFRPSAARAAWRQQHGYADDERLLVYAGRFAPEKNLAVLAAAVERLGAPYRLLCIGAGPSAPPAGERLRTLPFLHDAAALALALGSADAFVHAGAQETFGLSVLEAMACGTPAVVRDAEGLGEMIDGSCGQLVGDGTAGAFAAAIESLFGADRETLRAGARARAECCDWSAVFPQLVGHCERLLGRTGTLSVPPMASPAHSQPAPSRSAPAMAGERTDLAVVSR